jgi:hypothetical protein
MSVVDTRVKRPGWLMSTPALTWTLYLYAAWYLLAAALVLGRAAGIRGHLYLPAQGDGRVDPAQLWPGSLSLVGVLVLFAAMFAHLFAAGLVVVGVSRLVKPEVRARRRAWMVLLAGTVLVAATVVLALSAPGETVRGWLLD